MFGRSASDCAMTQLVEGLLTRALLTPDAMWEVSAPSALTDTSLHPGQYCANSALVSAACASTPAAPVELTNRTVAFPPDWAMTKSAASLPASPRAGFLRLERQCRGVRGVARAGRRGHHWDVL